MTLGKLTKSFKKITDNDTKYPLASTNLAFSHEFSSAGETVINFNTLNISSEWISSGRSNPTPAAILGSNLRFFKNQIILTSSSKGIIQPSQYQVTNSSIKFSTFVSEIGESFEVQVLGMTALGHHLVDGRSLKVEATLISGTTDFNIGMGVKIFPEQILVIREGVIQTRNESNSAALTFTGDYYMYDPANSGVSSVVRFNTTMPSDQKVIALSLGSFIEKPTLSMMSEIESVAGKVNAMIPYVATLASVPESTFSTSPTYVDLAQFSSLVNRLVEPAGSILTVMNTETQMQLQKGTKWILADGRDITGSDLHTIQIANGVTNPHLAPDLRGVVLRGKNNGSSRNPDGEVALGTFQGDQFFQHTHIQNSHTHTEEYPFTQTTAAPIDGVNFSSGGNARYLTKQSQNSGAATATNQNSGGNETRMKNITVNHFIKINNGL